MHPLLKDNYKIRHITPPKEAWDVIQINFFLCNIKRILNKKNQKYKEFMGLYKFTKMPTDIIDKILEYNY